MIGLLKTTCGNCGQVRTFRYPKNLDFVCQECGCLEMIFEANGRQVNLECLLCGQVISHATRQKVDISHECKKQKVSIFRVVDYEGKPLRATDNVVLVRRDRGLGDVLMTTVILPHIRERYSDKEIWYECDKDVHEILIGNPYLDNILTTGESGQYDGFYKTIELTQKLENYSENKGANKKDRIDRMFEICSLPLPRENSKKIKPQFYLENHEKKWAKNIINSRKPKIGLGLESHAYFRNWSNDQYQDLISHVKKKFEVILFGVRAAKIFGTRIVNTTGLLNVRELAAIISICDVIVCGDTGLYHVAESLGVPSIVLFGSIPSNARIKYYKNVLPIQADGIKCSPCWDRQFSKDPLLYKKCHSGQPICMQSISTEMVLSKIDEIMK